MDFLKRVLGRKREYVIAGHSHAYALGLSWEPADPPKLLPIGEFEDAVVEGLCGKDRDQPYFDRLVEVSAGKTVLLFWQGNQHAGFWLVEPQFDFYCASAKELGARDDCLIVPEEAVRAFIEAYNAPLHDCLQHLVKVKGCKPVVCGTPPPTGDDKHLSEAVFREPTFPEFAKRIGVKLEEVVFASRLTRLKLWIVLQDLLREAAERAGAEFFPVPAALRDPEGFIRLEHRFGDVTHANAEYGKAYLREFLAR